MRHPVALADAGVGDLLGGRPFAGAWFGEGLGFALRILRRFIAVPTPDVPADAFVPAVHLVGTGKVHLARPNRLVAVAREVAGDGHRFARHLVVVFEGAGVVRVQTGEKALPRWHADGRGGIGVAEVCALIYEPIEGGRANVGIAFNRHNVGAVFIVDEQQDMGLFFGHDPSFEKQRSVLVTQIRRIVLYRKKPSFQEKTLPHRELELALTNGTYNERTAIFDLMIEKRTEIDNWRSLESGAIALFSILI